MNTSTYVYMGSTHSMLEGSAKILGAGAVDLGVFVAATARGLLEEAVGLCRAPWN